MGNGPTPLKATVLALVPLGIVYLATSYGIVPMVRWASERSVALADSIGSVLRRALLLLRVAGFLATFAGLSFTVYLVTDPTYRNEFRTDVASELREAFGVRAAYRWAQAEESSPITAGPGA
jgi:hypothetical protein